MHAWRAGLCLPASAACVIAHVRCARWPPCRAVQVLETSPGLFFHLQQQRLIELIRGGETEAALDFAQEYLAPLAEDQSAFLEEMGKHSIS